MLFKKLSPFAILFFLQLNIHGQDVDKIIQQYILFMGGTEKWKMIQTVTTSGTYNYGGLEFPYTALSKAPDLYEYMVTFKGKSFAQGFNGKQGWRMDGFKNETQKTILNDKYARAMANEFDVELESPFIDYKKKGHVVHLEGTDTVDHKLCYKIKLTRNNGETETYYFDSENFALVKKQAISKNSELPNTKLDIYYTDYRTIDGLTLPYKISCSSNGQDILVITVHEIKLNTEIPDSLFNP